MKRVEVKIIVECPDKEHLPVSSFLKTMCQAIDASIENRNSENDCRYFTKDLHQQSEVITAGERHPLRDSFNL